MPPTGIDRLKKALADAKCQCVDVRAADVLEGLKVAGSLEVDQVLYALHKGSSAPGKPQRMIAILAKDLAHLLEKASHG